MQRLRMMSKQIVQKRDKVLITGGCGQIGLEFVEWIKENQIWDVVNSDIQSDPQQGVSYEKLDVTDFNQFRSVVDKHSPDILIHLAAVISAVGEQKPQLALKINVNGVQNALEIARMYNLKVFIPSTIAVFGPDSPNTNTPNSTIMRPTTIYGCTKVYLELLGEWYNKKYGVDFRSLRFPGLISSSSLPGGGTTDYAVKIFYDALSPEQTHECFLDKHQTLPFMYMEDALRSIVDLLTSDQRKLSTRVYNVTACSFNPEQITNEIKNLIPNFKTIYKPDHRSKIAASWPQSIDDSKAREDWGWNPKYGVKQLVDIMITKVGIKLQNQNL